MLKAKVLVAEFIGTFALVFVGTAAAIYDKTLGILGIALAYGLTLAVFVYLYGRLSGAHFNPAITLGLVANGNMKWADAALYWLAQFLGAIAAAALLLSVGQVSSDVFVLGELTGHLTSKYPWSAIIVEALLTFFLMTTYLYTMVDGKPVRRSAAWALGAILAVGVLAGFPLTGASMNPARSFGPALFTSAITAGKPDYQNTWLYFIYFAGPCIGALLAALLYRFFMAEPGTAEESDAVEAAESTEPEATPAPPAARPASSPASRKGRRR